MSEDLVILPKNAELVEFLRSFPPIEQILPAWKIGVLEACSRSCSSVPRSSIKGGV